MNKKYLVKLACISLICGTAFLGGCGSETISFSELYKNSNIEQKYNTTYSQNAVSLADSLVQQDKFLIQR